MNCNAQSNKLKAIALRNTRSTLFAYAIPALIYSPIVSYSGLSSVPIWAFLVMYGVVAAFILVNLAIIQMLPKVSYELGAPILYTQVAFFMGVFVFWIVMLEQGRYGGLFFAFSMLVYTYAYGSKALAISINTAIVVLYLAGSYHVLSSQGNVENFTKDILAIMAFLPVSIILGRVGSKLALKKRKVKALFAEQKATEQKLQETLFKLEHAATTDELTGLINRREINNRLSYEYQRLNRTHANMSILILDLDHFKSINDHYGHPCGDEVLNHVASCLTSAFRSTDSVSRWGGEEFIVLMPATSLAEAHAVSDRALETIARSPIRYKDSQITVTASGGISEVIPSEGVESALHHADECLYEAKKLGRNQIISSMNIQQVC